MSSHAMETTAKLLFLPAPRRHCALKFVTIYIEIFPRDSSRAEKIMKSEMKKNGNKFHVVLNQTRILLREKLKKLKNLHCTIFHFARSFCSFQSAALLLSWQLKSIVGGNNSPVSKRQKNITECNFPFFFHSEFLSWRKGIFIFTASTVIHFNSD